MFLYTTHSHGFLTVLRFDSYTQDSRNSLGGFLISLRSLLSCGNHRGDAPDSDEDQRSPSKAFVVMGTEGEDLSVSMALFVQGRAQSRCTVNTKWM